MPGHEPLLLLAARAVGEAYRRITSPSWRDSLVIEPVEVDGHELAVTSIRDGFRRQVTDPIGEKTPEGLVTIHVERRGGQLFKIYHAEIVGKDFHEEPIETAMAVGTRRGENTLALPSVDLDAIEEPLLIGREVAKVDVPALVSERAVDETETLSVRKIVIVFSDSEVAKVEAIAAEQRTINATRTVLIEGD
jgi:hypothetical protein